MSMITPRMRLELDADRIEAVCASHHIGMRCTGGSVADYGIRFELERHTTGNTLARMPGNLEYEIMLTLPRSRAVKVTYPGDEKMIVEVLWR